LWVMCYCGPMGYGTQIPAHQIGGQIGLWGIRGYGLSGVCDKRGSTVSKVLVIDPSSPWAWVQALPSLSPAAHHGPMRTACLWCASVGVFAQTQRSHAQACYVQNLGHTFSNSIFLL
ncbi:hypothetical protein EI94DRAFT_1635459, partial [Lactarius quietus]